MTPSAIHHFCQDVYGLDIPYSPSLEQLIETAMLIGYNNGWTDSEQSTHNPPSPPSITHHDILGATWLITPSLDAPNAWDFFHEDAESPTDPRRGIASSPQDAKDQILRRCIGQPETWPFYSNAAGEEILSIQKLPNNRGYRAVEYTSPDDNLGKTITIGSWNTCLRALEDREQELEVRRAEAMYP